MVEVIVPENLGQSWVVTEQDPMGPSRAGPSPISSALAPPLRTLIIVSDAHFLSCFTDAKTTIKGKK